MTGSMQAMLEQASIATSAQACLQACQLATRAYPHRFDVYHRTLLLLLKWDLIEQASGLLDQCAERLPDEHLPRLYQALHAMSAGQLQHGFTLRENLMRPIGWQRRTTAEPPATYPAWQGESLVGKSIVIWSEFGLGDEIFFFRFARIFREVLGAARVSVLCQTPLVSLFEASDEADAIIDIAHAYAVGDHDYWVYPHAIPAYLPLDLEALPCTAPYLRLPWGNAPMYMRGSTGMLKVGLVFKGAPTHENDSYRSLPSLAVLDGLFDVPGVDFYSLQKGAGAEEASAYAARLPNFYDVGIRVHSMGETARAVAMMDVVLTVDTSVAHLAAALGKPTWILLPFYGDWRWHYTRDDSPWYPTARLFRRRLDGDWPGVIARVRECLVAFHGITAGSEHASSSS